jgi:EAL domain-containing protein (putative c-di-GMP-specific phosphodiesterase class I)
LIWQENYNLNAIISVNISPVQLKQEDFDEKVRSILKKTRLKPEYLELEITENVLINSFDIIEMLWKLKRIGVKISLDDFGTGFSSLNYLTKLPLDTLKIDKTFVDYIKNTSKEKAITESIISLVHKLEFEVIAEGVETKNQLEYLTQSNCDNVQGFLFCKPLVESELKDIIEKGEIIAN